MSNPQGLTFAPLERRHPEPRQAAPHEFDELAITWLGEGIERAMRIDDPEGIVDQLSHFRRHSLRALGRD